MQRARLLMAGLVLAALLPGCASPPPPEPVSMVRMIQTTSYPELPDIELPIEPELLPWEYAVPVDLSRKVPKSSARNCVNVPEKDRDDDYEDRCLEHPVVRNSNVLFGFDQRNWNILLTDFSKLREYIVQLKARINLANDWRREQRQKAQDERRRTEATAAGIAAKPASAP